MKELSTYVIPLIMSGPNSRGFPKESIVFRNFQTYISSLLTNIDSCHLSMILTLTHNFLLRVICVSLVERLKLVGATVNSDGSLSNFSDNKTAMDKFFAAEIDSELIEKFDFLYGFDDFVQSYRNDTNAEKWNVRNLKSHAFLCLNFAYPITPSIPVIKTLY